MSVTKNRYLLSFSYIGTYFKGSAKINKDSDLTTVIGALETAIYKYCAKSVSCNSSPLIISSRTDRGVHAFQNTAHFDVTHRNKLCVETLRCHVNSFFMRKNIPLRVDSIQQVSKIFNARYYAKSRTYLYRLAVPKYNDFKFQFPLSEWGRCHILRDASFNLDVVKEVLALFPGTHDFTSFMSKPAVRVTSPIRCIHSFSITPGKSFAHPHYEPSCLNYDFWDFSVEGASFVYNQVRRMLSAVLAVEKGKISIATVQKMLDSPAPCTGLKYRLAPAWGLYLSKVSYDDAELDPNRSVRYSHQHLELLHLLGRHTLQLKKTV